MAKTKMLCPFSNKLCEECAFYRGRHYYLSFCRKYRGHVDETEPADESRNSHMLGEGNHRSFEIPAVIAVNALDPFLKPLEDIK